MSAEPWPTDAEREALRRCRSFAAGNAYGVPVEAREQHLEYLLDSLASHVARREREARAEGRRQGSAGCGCVLCCASMPPEMVASDLHRGSCPAQRADRIEQVTS